MQHGLLDRNLSYKMSGPNSHHYSSQRLKLHYLDWGNHDAPTLVMIHGGYDHCRSWDWMAQALRDEYHVLAPDLRGHGDSEWVIGGSYELTDFAFDIAQLLRHVGHKPVRILGHSFGGFVSLLFAGTFPELVSRLIAIDPFIHYSPQRLRSHREDPVASQLNEWSERLQRISAREPRHYLGLEEARQRMMNENPHLSHDQARHLTINGTKQNEDGSYSWKYDPHYGAMPPQWPAGPECMQLWSRIDCPALLLQGSECSESSDPERNGALACFSNARAVRIPDTGHSVHHQKMDQVLHHVRAVLAD